MDWQQLSALGIVALTAGVFAWNRWRRRSFSLEKDTHCGCSGTGLSAGASVVFKARKGERRQIITRAG